MFRIVAIVPLVLGVLSCGPKIKVNPDAGEPEEDAGVVVDAGRPRGDDPPKGWSVALALPAGAAATTILGAHVSSTGDQFGQPLIAALYEDPNGDATYDDSRVIFSRWDGQAKAFTEPTTVEVVGGTATVGAIPNRDLSISRDPDTGRIAIAYIKPQDGSVRLAVSDDDGVNFSLSTVSSGNAPSNATVIVSGGKTWVAWIEAGTVQLRTRSGDDAFTPSTAPGAHVTLGTVSLQLDAAGHAGVAWVNSEATGTAPSSIAFWRPGSSTATTVDTTPLTDFSKPTFRPSVSLAFDGEVPVVAYHLRKEPEAAQPDPTIELWFARATDASGSSWGAPVAIPRNSTGSVSNTTAWFQAIDVQASRVVIAADWAANGATSACRGPKLAVSTDDGATFQTCSPGGQTMASPVTLGGNWISLWPYSPTKETIVFAYDSRANPLLGPGVVMWREP